MRNPIFQMQPRLLIPIFGCSLASLALMSGCGVEEVLYPNREPQCKVGCDDPGGDDDAKPAPGSKRKGENYSLDAQFWLDATPFSRLNEAELGDLLLANPILLKAQTGGQESLGLSMQSGLTALHSLIEGAARIDAATRQEKPIADCYVKELEALPTVSAQGHEYLFNPGLCFPLDYLTESTRNQSSSQQVEMTVLAYEDAYRVAVPLDQDSFSLADAAEPYGMIHFGRSPAAPYLPLLKAGPRNLRRLDFSHVQLEAVQRTGQSGTTFDLIWSYFGLLGSTSSDTFSMTSEIDESQESVTWTLRGNLVQVNGVSSDPNSPSIGQARDVAAYGRVVQFNDLTITVPIGTEGVATPIQALEMGTATRIGGSYLLRIPQPGGTLEFLALGKESACDIELFAGSTADTTQSLGVTSFCMNE